MLNSIECASYEDALELCRGFKSEGRFDFFRGQSNDWPKILPSLLRATGSKNKKGPQELLDEFVEWARAIPQMLSYSRNDAILTAIAQHYGVPTRFLDLTYDPTVASVFSKTQAPLLGSSVIYCFKRSDIESLKGMRLLEFEVGNLWRLSAQHGLFVEFEEGKPVADLKSIAFLLKYPTSQVSKDDLSAIYPVRKSHLETVLDQYFYRSTVGGVLDLLSTTSKRAMIRRQTYPGIFKKREVPDFDPSWIEGDPRWVIAPLQNYDRTGGGQRFVIKTEDLEGRAVQTVARLRERLQKTTHRQIAERAQIDFSFERNDPSDKICGDVTNRVWDGLRAHPYVGRSLELGMARSILAIHRRSRLGPTREWEEELWKEIQHLDACPIGGHLDGGKVSAKSFGKILTWPGKSGFHRFYKRMARSHRDDLLHLIIEPWILYDFRELCALFCEQLVPSMAGYFVESCIRDNEGDLSSFWGLSFNPALLGFMLPSNYRMLSPLGLERNIDKLILIHKAMNERDMLDVFCDALSIVLRDQKPFIVRFTEFSLDEREIWEIPEAEEMCRAILRVGGISVLEVFEEQTRSRDDREIRGPGGLSAFHIWMIAHGLVSELNGKPIPPNILARFHSDLLRSNSLLEDACGNLARAGS